MSSFLISRLNKFLLVGLLLASLGLQAQDYMFPIRPGEQNYLSGTMGELRSTHFHAAIDIKTSGISGLPVFAAFDGFVNRIKISTGGYGNALYMAHPNGYYTVYAHLQEFDPEIQDWVRQQQYKKQSFEIELFPERDQFSYKRGEIIGKSGNTGSSLGPHLHFEIRDQNQHVLDPLKFGFQEIKDNLPPVLSKIAFKTLDIDARVNGQFGTFVFDPVLKGNTYELPETISLKGKIGVAIYAYDRLNGVPNKNGIPCIDMKLDDQTVFQQNIENLSFGEMRNIMVHMDYPLWQATGNKFNKLYVDDGNSLAFLNNHPPTVLNIQDTLPHNLSITLTDSYQNVRQFKMEIGPASKDVHDEKITQYHDYQGFELTQNVLEYRIPADSLTRTTKVYTNRMTYEQIPAYSTADFAYYLWDLRNGLPDSIDICDGMLKPNFQIQINPGEQVNYFHNDFQIETTRRDLFDTLYLRFQKSMEEDREIFHFQNEVDPFKSWFKLTLKPDKSYNPEKSHVYTISNRGDLGFVGGEWQGQSITFGARDLVKFTVATDTIAPTVKPLTVSKNTLRFSISDERSGVKSFDAYVNDQWVLMNYDYKRNLIWSEKLNENIPFAGEVMLKVSDNAGNETIYSTKI